MNALSIAWKLFRHNLSLYRIYVTVLGLAAAVGYNFLAVSLNPYMRVLSEQYVYAQTAGILGSIVLSFTLFFFMFHANGFFYKLRYKEIGIYMLSGIGGDRIGAVIALESLFTGLLAIAIGLPVGILFSKLFFMLLGQAMILGVTIPFYISIKPVFLLCFILLSLVLIMGLTNYHWIKHSRLIGILNAAKEEQKPPGKKSFRGILSLILIGAAYYLVLNITSMPELWPLSFLRTAILSLLMICFGTYLFFGSFLGIVFDRLIRNKRIIYRKTRLVSFSNTYFRLRANYRNLSVTAILCAASLAAFSGSLALKSFADSNTVIEAPFSIMFSGQNDEVRARIFDYIKESDHRITGVYESHFLNASFSLSGGGAVKTGDCLVASYSEALGIQESIEADNREVFRIRKYFKDTVLSDSEAICILHPNLILSAERKNPGRLELNGTELHLISTIRAPFAGSLEAVAGRDVYVVSDSRYRRLAEGSSSEQSFLGINISGQQDSMELVQKIASAMKNPRDNLNSFAGRHQYKYYLIGAFYFMGLVMAIIFIISSFSTMYFKLLSDAVYDREQYGILIKIGMSRAQIRHSIFIQTGLAFVPAVILGLAHGTMANKALECLVRYRFTGSLLTGAALMLTVMIAFYFIMGRRYADFVLKEETNDLRF